jgi:hypothetical protein
MTLLEIFAPAIRIVILWAFTRFATMGYLTPENASELTKVVMDLLVYGLPIAYAAWASWREAKRP